MDLLIRALGRRVYVSNYSSEENKTIRPTVVILDGPGDSFSQLNEIRHQVRTYLIGSIREKWLDRAEKAEVGDIGVHIRFGDFSSQKHPISWYVDAINFVRSIAGCVKVSVFSDASVDEIAQVLSMDNVNHVKTGSAISDLVALSSVKFLIGTGSSSFSAWACYLGEMPAMTRDGNPFSWFGLYDKINYIGVWNKENPDSRLIDSIRQLVF